VYHLDVTTAARLRAAFVAASVVWAALLVAVPFLASRDHASGPASLLIVAVYAIGGFVCHQLPARSYQLWSAQMPVCARCAGIYFGAVLGAIAASFRTAEAVRHNRPEVAQGFPPSLRFGEARRSATRGGGSPASVRFLLALAAAPTIATLVYEWTTGVMPAHAVRAAAGAAIGAAVAWVVVAAADNQVN
jgi:hypothetical protein